MNHIKLFEDFNHKIKNIADIIKKSGYVFAKSVKNNPDHDPEEPVRALSIDSDGLVTVDISGREYEVDLENVEIAPYVKESVVDKEKDLYSDFLSYFQNLKSDDEINTNYIEVVESYAKLSKYGSVDDYGAWQFSIKNSNHLRAVRISYFGLENTREYISSGHWTRYKGSQSNDLAIIYSTIYRFEKMNEGKILIFHEHLSNRGINILAVFPNS